METLRLHVVPAGHRVPATEVALTPPARPALLADLCEHVLDVERRFVHPSLGGRLHPLAPRPEVAELWADAWRLASMELSCCESRGRVAIWLFRTSDVERMLRWAPRWAQRYRDAVGAGLLHRPSGTDLGLLVDGLCDQIRASSAPAA